MWLTLTFLLYYSFWAVLITSVDGHLPDYMSTPANKIDQFCDLADSCVHDTIPVCGMMGEEKRTFLDICDLLEYICDTNQVYSHIDDTDGCPVFKN